MIELYEIIVPCIRNNGKPIHTRFHRIWDEKIRQIAGGLSILRPLKGYWTSPEGNIYIERGIPVRIACTKAQIEQIADMSAKYYEQHAIMYYRISDCVTINQYDEKKKFKRTSSQ